MKMDCTRILSPMKKRIKTNQIPNRAKDLYVQLYCEKRGRRTSECIRNATQSWLSLSLTKKRHFYNTLSTKSVVKKAQPIIHTKPFLKAKDPRNLRKRKFARDSNGNQQNEESGPESSSSEHNLPIQHDEMGYVDTDNLLVNNENSINGSLPSPSNPGAVNTAQEESEAEYGSEETENNLQISEAPERPSYMSVIDEDTNTSTENKSNEKEAEHSMPKEPIVPIIKNGKELYELLNSKKGTNAVPYESLTAREKRFYGNAVSRIKREFVKNYKAYLESLTSKQLYDYYLKLF